MQHLSLILLHAFWTRNGLSSANIVKYEQAKHRRGFTVILQADINDKNNSNAIIICIFKRSFKIFCNDFVYYTSDDLLYLTLVPTLETFHRLGILVTVPEHNVNHHMT